MFGLSTLKLGLIAGAILIVVGSAGLLYHGFAENLRKEGDARTHKVMDPELAAANARADRAEALLAQADAREKRMLEEDRKFKDEQKDREAKRAAATAKDRAEIDRLRGQVKSGAGIVVPSDVGGVWNAAAGFANARGGDATTVGSGSGANLALPGSAEAETETYDERETAGYFADSAAAYRSCNTARLSCIEQYNGAREGRVRALSP